MSLNESIVEDAALEWFGEQFRCACSLTRPFASQLRTPQGEEKREAIRRMNPTIPHALLP